MTKPRILVFDSGMGGLTVAKAVRAAEPEATLIYAADNAAFPYGAWDEPLLVKRIVAVIGKLIAQALGALRERYTTVPFVGTVPAIKPAAEQTKTGLIGVLATPATVNREYTKTLIHTYAYHCKVFLHGAKRLAEIAEAKLKGQPVDKNELKAEIMPVFRKRDDRLTDVVVLGCTHYPLLLEEIREVAPWPVTYIDPAPAIARRVSDLLRSAKITSGRLNGAQHGTVFLTSARGRGNESLAAYAAMGFSANEVLDLPV
jgi:glutamate racemase